MRRVLLALLLGSALPVVGAPAESAVAGGACSAGQVSLTFDDGPSTTVTPRLVRTLTDLHVPATFFMVGERVASAPAAARLVARSGFLVANHSYRHTNMTRQSRTQIRETLFATDRRLRATGLHPTNLMRPPYGAIDGHVRDAVGSTGLIPVLWDVDPRDWETGTSTATIASRILAQLRPHRSNVVLQHDGVGNSPASIAAVPRVVREARRRGYCFVALDEAGRPGFPTPRARVDVRGGAEGSRATVAVTLDRPTARLTHLRLRTVDGTARAGDDHDGRDLVVSFPAGTQRRVVAIPLRADGLDEPTERFGVRLSEPSGLVLADDAASVTITDRDPPPRVRVLDASVTEPTADAVTTLEVRLARPSGRPVQLRVADVPGTATSADYRRFDAIVRIPAGQTLGLLPVTVLADTVDESEESFTVRILRAEHARSLAPPATVTILPPAPAP